jgi:cell division protein FtsW
MLRPGHVVFLCALMLLCIGVIMVNSAGMSVKAVRPAPGASTADATHAPHAPAPEIPSVASPPRRFLSDDLWAFTRSLLLSKPTAYLILAVGAMCAVAALPVRSLASIWEGRGGAAGHGEDERARRAAMFILLFGTALILLVISTAYWPGVGKAVNGSRRWISLPIPGFSALSFQPSELAKWGLIVVLAMYIAARGSLMASFARGLVPGLAATGLVAGAVAHEDLGTGVLIGAAGAIVLVAGGARFWHFMLFIPPAVVGFLALCIANPYRLRRLESFLDPYLHPQGSGYHMIQSMAAVAGGQGFGRGLGHGLQKFGYLPEDTTDFLFAIICEELGIAGACAVVCLYILLLWAGLAVIRGQSSTTLKLLGLGIIITVGLQALINLAVVTGLGPTKGIALPLISAGGTGWVLTAASLGLLVAMDRCASEAGDQAELDLRPPLPTHPHHPHHPAAA